MKLFRAGYSRRVSSWASAASIVVTYPLSCARLACRILALSRDQPPVPQRIVPGTGHAHFTSARVIPSAFVSKSAGRLCRSAHSSRRHRGCRQFLRDPYRRAKRDCTDKRRDLAPTIKGRSHRPAKEDRTDPRRQIAPTAKRGRTDRVTAPVSRRRAAARSARGRLREWRARPSP